MILQVRDLAREYRMGDEQVHALRGVSFSVEQGEYVAIVGPSGCGKSTLLNLLGVIDRPTSGTVAIAGERVSHSKNSMSISCGDNVESISANTLHRFVRCFR